MISEIANIKRICKGDFTKIANYNEAINDARHIWNLHHKLGLNHSRKELIDNNLYYHRPPEELEFLRDSINECDTYSDIKCHTLKHADAKQRIEAEFEFNSFVDRLSREMCKDSEIINDKLRFESWIESLLSYERISKRLDIEGLSVHTGLKESFIKDILEQ